MGKQTTTKIAAKQRKEFLGYPVEDVVCYDFLFEILLVSVTPIITFADGCRRKCYQRTGNGNTAASFYASSGAERITCQINTSTENNCEKNDHCQ